MQYISPISLDLGAQNTGTLFSHYKQGEEPISHKGATFILDSNNFTFSQKKRTTNRHRMRSQQRRKLAKRLFFLILDKEYGLKEEDTPVWKFIRGLLNRRGFTYLQEEITEETTQVPLEYAQFLFPEEFENCKIEVLEFLRQLANEDQQKALQTWKKIYEFKNYAKKEKEFQKENQDYDSKTLKNFSKTLKNITGALIKAVVEQGNKHRKVYLEEICFDIKNSQDLKDLLTKAKNPITTKEFFHILGHISNLQLRILRKYFNDPNMANGKDYWDPERLKKFFIRYLQAWHVKKETEEQRNQLKLLDELKNKSILQVFIDNSPTTSIPPYEDQNNRHIPTCQNLLLSAKKLDEKYEGWREIVKKLAKKEIISTNEEKKFIPLEFYDPENIKLVIKELTKSLQGANKDTSKIPFDEDSILFQRVLETSIALDLYEIRLHVDYLKNANGKTPEEYFGGISTKRYKRYEESEKNLQVAKLTEDEKRILFEIARRVYEDTVDARRGLWDSNFSLFEKCNSKTKHKNKTQKMNVMQILRISDKKDFSLEKFKQEVWDQKIERSAVKSLCKKIEETRKEYGNLFSKEYSRIKWKYLFSQEENLPAQISQNANNKKPSKKTTVTNTSNFSKEEQALVEMVKNVQKISKKIGEFLGHTEQQIVAYANPFSLAQLYNILETDLHGFNKICHACILETQWRSQRETNKTLKEEADKAVRLSSDTGRPFDGQIDRIVTRIAKEIAKEKIKQLSEVNSSDLTELEIPVFMEENQFSFTEEALQLKGSSDKAKKKLNKQIQKFEDRLKTKEERIKTDSGDICAYTGKSIGNSGEIDHIIPRSSTIDNMGAVYNSELNLMYVSREGNQHKGNNLYTLSKIHNSFLQEHFKTTNHSEIKNQIQKVIDKVKEINKQQKRNYIIPDTLEPNQRIALRLALFDNDLRDQVLPFISMHSKTLVNGTQAWFFKRLRQILFTEIKEKFPNVKVNITSHFFSTSEDNFALSQLRETLGNYKKAYKKEENQRESSHIIDATMVFAQALIQSNTKSGYNLYSPLIKDDTQETGEWLESLLPEEIEMKFIERVAKYRKQNPESSPIFKDGMYAERFLSLLVDSKGIRFGFTPAKSSETLSSKVEKEIFEALKPFLLYKGKFIDKDLDYFKSQASPSGFHLLKLHRNKVKEYLQNCKTEDKVSILLESLRYMTQNKNVLDEEGNLSKPQDKKESKPQDKKEKFQIKWNGKNILQFSVTMPYMEEWNKLEKFLQNVPKEKLQDKIKEFFHPASSIKNPNNHGTKARKMSLPVKKDPSGGFRILRTNTDKEKIYQVHEGDGPNIGFAINEDGSIDFSSAILSKTFLSKNVSPYKIEDKIPADKFIYFDEWRDLPISSELVDKGILQVTMKPDTKSRCYLKVTLKTNVLLKLLANQNLESIKKPQVYGITLSSKKDSELEQLAKFLKDNISDQRDYLYITNVDSQKVSVEFVANGFPGELKTLYNQGKKIDNP